MKIKKEISGKILTISSFCKGKGGIATVVNTLSDYYETFNYVASTRSNNPLIMLCYFVACVFQLLYYIFVKRIKIVHIHGASYGSFLRKMVIINICYSLGIKIAYHMHGGKFNSFHKSYNKWNIISKTLNKADIIITPANDGKQFFTSITDVPVIKINNIIDNLYYNKPYHKSPSIIKFLFLGRICKDKGIFDLIETINDNRDHLNNKFSLHVGGNDDHKKLRALIKKYNLQNLIAYEGWVFGERKKQLLASCDVFILPSYKESFGLANLEAMSYGMPVISTMVGGIPEVVLNNENGFLIEPGDKQQMYECISYFLTHPQEVEKMGRKSSALAVNFYPENIIPKLIAIYKSLLIETR